MGLWVQHGDVSMVLKSPSPLLAWRAAERRRGPQVLRVCMDSRVASWWTVLSSKDLRERTGGRGLQWVVGKSCRPNGVEAWSGEGAPKLSWRGRR